MCKMHQICASLNDDLICEENSVEKLANWCETAITIALPEVGKNTIIAMQRLLTMVSPSMNDLEYFCISVYIYIYNWTLICGLFRSWSLIGLKIKQRGKVVLPELMVSGLYFFFTK